MSKTITLSNNQTVTITKQMCNLHIKIWQLHYKLLGSSDSEYAQFEIELGQVVDALEAEYAKLALDPELKAEVDDQLIDLTYSM